MKSSALILAALGALAASPAPAGETACWFEGGVVIVPAEVMGVAGDYVLDTASPHTQLAETQAQGAGYADTALSGAVRLAGLTLRGQPVAVAAIDLRTGVLPTPVAGVIGADVLNGYVLDVRFAPCRIGLYRAGHAPPFRSGAALPLRWVAGRPVVTATVSDGVVTRSGGFSPGVGVDRAVRISDAMAQVPGAAKAIELYPYGILQPRLARLDFAGAAFMDLPSGLVLAEDPALAGLIGAPLLSRWRLRFDFPKGRLLLAPASPPRGARRETEGF